MTEKTLFIDFPDSTVADLYGKKYFNTAKILGIEYRYSSTEYGEGKFHLKVAAKGDKKSLNSFIKFIYDSTKLIDDINIREGTIKNVSGETFTAQQVKAMIEPAIELSKNWEKVANDWKILYDKAAKARHRARIVDICCWATLLVVLAVVLW